MNSNEDATQMVLLTASQLELVREGLGLLEATLSRDESDQIEQIHTIFRQLDTPAVVRAQGEPSEHAQPAPG
jgi:hypothetical protein